MMKDTAVNGVNYDAVILKDYREKAIQCCIDKWNKLCPQFSLNNLDKKSTRKRWVFCGPNVVTIKESGICGQISKISFGINNRLTAKALRKHKDLALVTVNCWIWWNCEESQVRGWLHHIVVDVKKESIVDFPEIAPSTPHCHFPPIP